MPLKDYYDSKGILTVFKGTESDVIYPVVNKFLHKITGSATQ